MYISWQTTVTKKQAKLSILLFRDYQGGLSMQRITMTDAVSVLVIY